MRTDGFISREGTSLRQKPGSTAGASVGASPLLLGTAALLAARLQQRDYTWVHFHFPTSPTHARSRRWLFFPRGIC